MENRGLRRAPGRLALVGAGAILLLALVEAVTAVVSPRLAPDDADWAAAAAFIRAEHREADLIVAAPAWADQVLRLHLGDLLPPRKAARMDDAIYGRVWVVSQRGAETEEGIEDSPGARLQAERSFGLAGRLVVRRFERPAPALIYDFVESWRAARVARVAAGGQATPCERRADDHMCPGDGFSFVAPRTLEIGGTLRRGLLNLPGHNTTMAVEYPDVPMGKELAVGAGLHNVWRRKGGDGTVVLRVLVDGREIGRTEAGNRTGWQVARFPTPAQAGRRATVRFEISSARPQARHFGFAAEARGS